MSLGEPTSPLWVCVDCYVLHVNGEVSDDVSDPDSLLSKIGDMEVTAGILAEEHADDCAMRNYPDVPDNHECDCETRTFSWSACEGCGSPLGGERHALTGWIKNPEASK